ncbi:hypothetical protein GGP92_001376 [Salinibacter ruber]|nr:hypothetical protein [Salinibacter ruber]
MSSQLARLIGQLTEAGFSVKIADGGVIAYLHSRTLLHHEIVDAVPDLESSPMETVEVGVFISFGEG